MRMNDRQKADLQLSVVARETLITLASAIPEIDRLILFGSRAQGTARSDSDIDLAVSGARLQADAVARLWSAIDDSDLLYPIDLVHLHAGTEPELSAAIARQGVVLWSRDR